MRNTTMKSKLLITILLASLALSACGGEMDPRLKALQGHWVDINSDASLEINGATFRFTSGGWREKYPFVLTENNGVVTLEPTYHKDFGFLSTITMDDGALTAYEMIMDGESHKYRFVREADKAAELEIKDLSEDLPKSVESQEMDQFSLVFSKDYDGQYGLDDFWSNGRYSWTVEKRDEGYWMEFDVSGSSYIILRFSDTVDAEWVQELVDLLHSTGAVEHNGYHRKNNRQGHDWGLWASFASDETLTLRAEGDAAAEMPFDLAALLEHAKSQGVKFWN